MLQCKKINPRNKPPEKVLVNTSRTPFGTTRLHSSA